MKKLVFAVLFILGFTGYAIAGSPVYGVGVGGGVSTDTNCNQSQYFAIGKLCQDTDDGKLYKGTGAAVEEVGAGSGGSFTAATSAEINTGTDNTKGITPAGLAGSRYNAVSGKVCKTITNPTDADNFLFDIASARTVAKVWGIAAGGTSAVVTLQNAGADGAGSTSIHSALTVDTDGASTTTISSATLTDGDVIKIDIGTVTGAVTQLMVCYE